MKNLSKTIVAIFLSTTLIQSQAHSAFVATSVSFGSLPAWALIPSMAYSAGMGFFGKGLIGHADKSLEDDSAGYAIIKGVGFVLLAAGIIVLDQENLSSMSFNRLSAQEVDTLGLSAFEAKKYNSRVAVLNQMAKSIQKSCMKKIKSLHPSDAFTKAPTKEDWDFAERCFENGWKAYQASNPKLIDADVFSTLQTIRHQELK